MLLGGVSARAEPAPPASEVLPTATSTADLVELGRTRLYADDPKGAQVVLHEALARSDVDADTATYLLGMAYEWSGDPAQALRLYEDGLARWPTSPLTPDRRYRRAEAFAALGHPREALDALDALDTSGLSEDDLRKVELAEGTFWLDLGRTRRGLRLLRDGLKGALKPVNPWSQARARAALARKLAREAAKLDFQTGQRRQRRHVAERAQLVLRIEKEVTAIADLKQPHWILDGVLTLGQTYESLASDLAHGRVPHRLTDDQARLYAQEIGKRVKTLQLKALRTYDLGLRMAVRLGLHDPLVAPIRRHREALAHDLDVPVEPEPYRERGP